MSRSPQKNYLDRLLEPAGSGGPGRSGKCRPSGYRLGIAAADASEFAGATGIRGAEAGHARST